MTSYNPKEKALRIIALAALVIGLIALFRWFMELPP